MKKLDVVKAVGMAGMLLGAIATLVSDWAREKSIEQRVDERIGEALAKHDIEES